MAARARTLLCAALVDVDDPKSAQTGGGIPANMRGSIPVTRVTKRNGEVVWVKGADGSRIDREYRS
jgi:hypothetical protein